MIRNFHRQACATVALALAIAGGWLLSAGGRQEEEIGDEFVLVRNAGWEQGARDGQGQPVEDWRACQPSGVVVADPELLPLGIPERLARRPSLSLDWHPRSGLRAWLYSRQDDAWKPLGPGRPFSPPAPDEVPAGAAALYLEGLDPGPTGQQRLSLSLGEAGRVKAQAPGIAWQATLLGLGVSESGSAGDGHRQLSLAWPGPGFPEVLEVHYLEAGSEPAAPFLGLRLWLETGDGASRRLAPGAYTRDGLRALGLKKGGRALHFRIEAVSPPPGTLAMDEQALEIVLRPHPGMPALRIVHDFSGRDWKSARRPASIARQANQQDGNGLGPAGEGKTLFSEEMACRKGEFGYLRNRFSSERSEDTPP